MTKHQQAEHTSSSHYVPTPHDMDRWISWLLRGGVLLSLVFLVIGTVITLIHHPDYLNTAISTHTLQNPAKGNVPHHVVQIFDMMKSGQGQGLVAFGLLILIATPVMRVALSVVTFWLEKDHAFVIITAGVLLLLILSLLLGKAG
ncbi:MAG: DUF1634 domain-containing protein [Abditibacteriaceae bacterium]